MSVIDPDAPKKDSKDRSHRDIRRHKNEEKRRKEAGWKAQKAAPSDQAHYLAMSKVVMDALPDHAPGVPVGAVFEAARSHTSRHKFPGDTHRMWARQVIDDLRATGAVHEDAERHLWRSP
jgi:hypothetical protein